MVQALVTLKEETNKVLNVVKAKHDFKDKGEAIEYIVNKFVELEEPELKEEFISKMQKVQKDKLIKVDNFAKRYGLNV
ncbi:MAG: antitoxin [archaeon]